MSVQSFLEFDMDVVGGVIHEDAASRVHLLVRSLSQGREQTTFNGTHKVIRRDLLTDEEMILSNHSSFVLDNGSVNARCGACGLFSELAWSAPTRVNNLAGCSMQLFVCDACCQYTRT
jgi:hypothetical protein